MCKNRCGGKRILKKIKGGTLFLTKIKRYVLPSKPGEGNNDVGEVVNEAAVEIGKAEEGLNILNLPRLQPIPDCRTLSAAIVKPAGDKM